MHIHVGSKHLVFFLSTRRRAILYDFLREILILNNPFIYVSIVVSTCSITRTGTGTF